MEVVQALAAIGPTSKQYRAATSNVLSTLRSQSAVTNALKRALRSGGGIDEGRPPRRDWWPYVRELLYAGADPNVLVREITVLVVAAWWNNMEVLNAALTCGADPNLVAYGGTALDVAGRRGHEQIVARLLAAKANPDSALFAAVERGHRQIVAMLLAAKVDPNVRDQSGHTPLMVAVTAYEAWTEKAEDMRHIVYMLLDAKADPNLQDGRGSTALTKAIDGNWQMFVVLLDAKATLDKKWAGIALVRAAFRPPERIVSRLLAAKADPDAIAIFGGLMATALMVAAAKGNERNVAELLAAKANPDLRTQLYPRRPDRSRHDFNLWWPDFNPDNDDNSDDDDYDDDYDDDIGSPAHVPGYGRRKYAGGWTALMFAAANGHEQIVARLLSAKANPNLMDGEGQTALMFAAEKGCKKMVARLLAAKANPDLKRKVFLRDRDGPREERQRYTALMLAARQDLHVPVANTTYKEIVAMLLAAGARPSLRDPALKFGDWDVTTTSRIKKLVTDAQNRRTVT